MTTESMPSSAYAALDGDSYRPSSLTRGPWHPDHQHAGPPIALMCRAIENAALKLGLSHLSRLTANLLRPVPIRDLTIEVITNYCPGVNNCAIFPARLQGGRQRGCAGHGTWPNVRTMWKVARWSAPRPPPAGCPARAGRFTGSHLPIPRQTGWVCRSGRHPDRAWRLLQGSLCDLVPFAPPFVGKRGTWRVPARCCRRRFGQRY